MKQETITTAGGKSYEKLTAADGCYLTQTEETEITARAFYTTICLGKSQSADVWTEIDAETYEAYQTELAEALAAIEAAQEAENAETESTGGTDDVG